MTPDKAVVVRDFLVEGLQMEAKTTRRVLEAVPEKGNDYRPDAKSRTGFDLAWHIASSDAWFLNGILTGEFKMEGDPEAANQVPPDIRSVADVVAFYDKNYIARIAELKSLSGEALAKVVNFFGAFNFPMVVYVSWLNNHQIHHRGQLCAYLRAMNSKVPNIYGGSADEPFEVAASA